jgi:hypothetical protein
VVIQKKPSHRLAGRLFYLAEINFLILFQHCFEHEPALAVGAW